MSRYEGRGYFSGSEYEYSEPKGGCFKGFFYILLAMVVLFVVAYLLGRLVLHLY